MDERPLLLGGRFQLKRIIGSGGMGVVWRAFDQNLLRDVACKVVSTPANLDPVVAKRFIREAQHVASLSHPHVVTVFDYGVDGPYSYLVMELVDGPSLRDILSERRTLSLADTAQLAVETLSALQQAHDRGIVHRDIKPANLLVSSAMGIKVADFGIAKSTQPVTEITAPGVFVGTSKYASPEQITGAEVGPASDLYALGAVLFECLTGHVPYEATDPGQQGLQHRYGEIPDVAVLRSDVPEDVSLAVARALAKSPADRFARADEMRDVFLPYATADRFESTVVAALPEPQDVTLLLGAPTRLGHGPGRVDEGRISSRISRRAVAVAAMVCALVAAAIVAFLIAGGTTPGSRPPLPRVHGLSSGGFLQPGQDITSPNGSFTLIMQQDGNLVEYRGLYQKAIWASETSGNFSDYVVMQPDGNLVVYPHGKSAPPPGEPTPALWQSETHGHEGASLTMLNSGVFVIWDARTGQVFWSSSHHDIAVH
jgi:Protein kinase domain